MRAAITIDDALYEQALEYADDNIASASDLVREAIKTYVRLQAAKRLAALGGAAPGMGDISRRGEPTMP